ncbi:MAG: hypothetical protein BWY63_03858 [Chloroflexi bacterium ADurb.Bin360]|nr:MAG: hypothetical protein BWY63_03858 [Chloroflexi bacterium ADurb.Bin360]
MTAWSAIEEFTISWTQKQILKHRVIREQDVGRGLAHLAPAEQFIGQHLFARELFGETYLRFEVFLFSFPRITSKSDGRIILKQSAQTFELVIG